MTNVFEKYTDKETFEKIVDYANITENSVWRTISCGKNW